MKFKIYISSMVQVDIDNYNRVAASDARLLRRLVRDPVSGPFGGGQLIHWPSVRQGRSKIFSPYQEETRCLTRLWVYETSVFKKRSLSCGRSASVCRSTPTPSAC